MKHNMYAIYDAEMRDYRAPFAAPHDAVARRFFMNQVRTEGTDLCNHPDDFELHQLGTIDTSTGQFTNQNTTIMRGRDAVPTKE